MTEIVYSSLFLAILRDAQKMTKTKSKLLSTVLKNQPSFSTALIENVFCGRSLHYMLGISKVFLNGIYNCLYKCVTSDCLALISTRYFPSR